MIWSYALEPRIVTVVIYQPERPRFAISNEYEPECYVKQQRPFLLDVCHETREYALAIYGSIHTPKDTAWEYTGSKKLKDVRPICRALGIRREPTDNLKSLLSSLDRHLNDPQSQMVAQHSKFLILGKHQSKFRGQIKGKPQILPVWFNPSDDILLFEGVPRDWWSRIELWGPWGSTSSTTIQHIGIDFTGFVYSDPFDRLGWWSRFSNINLGKDEILPLFSSDGRHARDAKSLSFIINGCREIMTLKLDSGTSLKPLQWSFSLDMCSNRFDCILGSGCATAIWEVTLWRAGEKSLWDVLAFWRPDRSKWWQQKVELLEKEAILHAPDETTESTELRKRNTKYDRSECTWIFAPLVLLEGGDGKTYLGPCV